MQGKEGTSSERRGNDREDCWPMILYVLPTAFTLQGTVSFDANGVRAGRRPLVNQYRYKGELQCIWPCFIVCLFPFTWRQLLVDIT